MLTLPPNLQRRLHDHGQMHLLHGWGDWPEADRAAFTDELGALDFDLLKLEHSRADARGRIPPLERIDIIPKPGPGEQSNEVRRLGEEALARGEVAVVLVAGGRGSRLGFEHPKGMVPIGPGSGQRLVQ